MKSSIAECPVVGYSLEDMRGETMIKPAYLDSAGDIVIIPDSPFRKNILRIRANT
jgi:hypothetical protein